MAEINYSERILELMRTKGITKSELGRMMDVQKQNVDALIKTNSIEKLIGIAKNLGVSLNDIIQEEPLPEEVKGCIIYKGIVHPINSKDDIQNILNTIE